MKNCNLTTQPPISKAVKVAAKRTILTASAFFLAFWAFLGALFTPIPASAEEIYAPLDGTTIEEDLAGMDTSIYPADATGTARLLDDRGFFEYAYAEDSFLAENYYGAYLYVYNPSQREISTEDGANHVNMAVRYDKDGEPAEYANIPLRYLDATSNFRFYKFKIDDAELLDRIIDYAASHDGERRYDLAGLQLWYKGDANATESNTYRLDYSYTFVCTGYAKGCGEDPEAASTLNIERKKLETVGLDVEHTYYRTDEYTSETEYGAQTTLTSVYFSVPRETVETYGALQLLKASWYEYKTSWIVVTDNGEAEDLLMQYRGHVVEKEDKNDFDENVPLSWYQYLGTSDSGKHGYAWNEPGLGDDISRYDWVIKTDDIMEEVNPSVLAEYAYNYEGKPGDETIRIGDKVLNANLFVDEVDPGHTRGYNERTYDARNEDDWIDLNLSDNMSVWDKFWAAIGGSDDLNDFVTAEDVLPIEEVTAEKLEGEPAEVSRRLLVAESRIEGLREYQAEAAAQDRIVYILRVGVTNYRACEVEFHDTREGGWFQSSKIDDGYIAQDTVYLDFDIIHLGFVLKDKVTIIAAVSDPIDIFVTPTPPPDMDDFEWSLVWWLAGVGGVMIPGAIFGAKLEKIFR